MGQTNEGSTSVLPVIVGLTRHKKNVQHINKIFIGDYLVFMVSSFFRKSIN